MTRLTLNDLPAHVRAKISDLASPTSCSGEGGPRHTEAASRPPARSDCFACHACPATATTLAAAQRHADENRHPRFDWRITDA